MPASNGERKSLGDVLTWSKRTGNRISLQWLAVLLAFGLLAETTGFLWLMAVGLLVGYGGAVILCGGPDGYTRWEYHLEKATYSFFGMSLLSFFGVPILLAAVLAATTINMVAKAWWYYRKRTFDPKDFLVDWLIQLAPLPIALAVHLTHLWPIALYVVYGKLYYYTWRYASP